MSVLVGVAVPVLVAGLAMAVDTGYLYLQKRLIQQQADTSALAAASGKAKGTTSLETLRSMAMQDARRNGYVAAGTSRLTMNVPPISGAYTGNATAVEVNIETEVDTFFARYLSFTSMTVRARAVAGYKSTSPGGSGCVLALHTSASQALRFQGSGSMTAPTCTLLSNSKASNSVFVGGNETVRALTIYTAGGVDSGPSAKIELTEPAQTRKSPVADPYADLTVPASASNACTKTNFSVSGNNPNRVIDPGNYCNGIDIKGSGTVYMKKGTYVIKGGDFNVGGTARVRCGDCTSATHGITIVLTEGLTGSVGTVSIAGTTDVQFSAPSGIDAGTMRGIAIFQDRKATAGNAAKLTGTSNMRISGAIYMPAADINFSGTSDLPDGKACVEIIGRIVEVQGNSRLSLTDCKAMGVHPIDAGASSPPLLE